MKKSYLILVFCVILCTRVFAADKYWVGPSGGNWNADINWSSTNGGVGGAGHPTSSDAVIFSGSALVNLNVSTSITSLRTSFGSNNVTLYTSIGSNLTILNSLRVEPFSTLKDSTSSSVAFNVIFSGATHATANIIGDWIFEGGVSLTGGTKNGARFTAESGSLVNVASSPFNILEQGGRIIFKKNTNIISSTAATLKFSYGSYYILEDNLSPAIPAATWARDSAQGPGTYSDVMGAPASTIQITGNMGMLIYSEGVPKIGRLVLDLSRLSADASLALPDGSKINGNLEILNTNNHTITLLAATGTSGSVQVEVGTTQAGNLFGGYLNISGNSTKVSLAKATAAGSSTSYKLLVNKSFVQNGGNFSLQDYDNATGSSTLAIKNDLIQNAGSFITNSTSTNSTTKFMVVMDDPNLITGPSGNFSSLRTLHLSSGSIDNGRHMVTLRIDHTVYDIPGFAMVPNGVMLQGPLEVGRLELASGPLTTSAANLLTVTDPSSGAITVGSTGKSYINGPLKRVTNSTQSYNFPTGKGNSPLTSYFFDSCSVIPSSVTPSVYQAEYFNTGISDLNVTAPLKGVLNNAYWDIARKSGSDAQVRLGLNGTVSGASAGDGLVVAHYTAAHWISEHGSVLTSGNATSGSVLSKQLSSFGPFTIGYVNPADLTPVVAGGLTYKFYQGVYTSLPDFNVITPVKTGNSSNIDIGIRPTGVNDGFAFIWQGTINIPTAGNYTFETVSDDGSKLYFNTTYSAGAKALVSNDGVHAAQSATGTVNVPVAGAYPFAITYFENNGGESMQVYWSGPGITRQLIPDATFKPAVQTANGLSYKYYQGIFSTLPDFSTLTPVKTGNSSNVDISVRPAEVNDAFAFVWEGYINIPAPGSYTFETSSDDGSKLYFNTTYSTNASALVNNDGLHAMQSATGTVNVPAAGLYPITVTFFENVGGEGMQLFWTGPGFSREQIPDAAFTSIAAALPVSGLNYKYYEGDFNVLPDFASITPVKTGSSANTDLNVRTPGVSDHYAFVWDGYINLPAAGTYNFETISDDGSKVYFNLPYSVNGTSTVSNDGIHGPVSVTGSVTVAAAGSYPITITFFEKDGGETMQLYWSGPGISRQLIPDAAFTTTNTAGNTISTSGSAAVPVSSAIVITETKVYPNPFVESFTIDYYNTGNDRKTVNVALYDLNGKLIYSYQPSNLKPGNNRWLINMGSKNLLPGVYIAQIRVNGVPVRSIKLIEAKK